MAYSTSLGVRDTQFRSKIQFGQLHRRSIYGPNLFLAPIAPSTTPRCHLRHNEQTITPKCDMLVSIESTSKKYLHRWPSTHAQSSPFMRDAISLLQCSAWTPGSRDGIHDILDICVNMQWVLKECQGE